MARRDVELVIRAKNEASKAVDSFTGAIQQLTGAQDALARSANGSGSTLQRLGSVLAEVTRAAAGGTAFDRMAASSTKATAAVARLEKEIASVAQEQQRFARETENAAAATNKLRDASARVAESLNEQKALAKRAAADQRTANSEVQAAERMLRRQEAAIAALTSRQTELRAKIAATQEPSDKLKASLQGTVASLQEQQRELGQTNSRLSELRAKQQAANEAVASTKTTVKSTTAELKSLGAQITASAANETRLSDALTKTRTSAGLLEEDLRAARTELTALSGVSGQAESSLRRLAGSVRLTLATALREQRQQVQDFRADWDRATQKVAANPAPRIGPPTAEQSANRVNAGAAKSIYEEQRLAVSRMAQAYSAAGTDVRKLADAQQTFESVLSGSNAKIAQLRASMVQVSSAAQAAASSTAATPAAIIAVGAATQQTNDKAGAFARTQALLSDNSRQAMSVFQRLRGEVLALATSYIGLQAALGGANKAIQSFMTVETITSRLGVVTGGDPKATQQEMAWLRSESDRLKVSMATLGQEWSKFAVAAKESVIPMGQARTLFIQFAEAGRVLKLSNEQMERMFLALTQMLSKGKIQAEELRQQLGEHLPGAFPILAKAIGVTTQELDKMLERGEVGSEHLIKFGNEIQKMFGSQLEASLKTTQAVMAQFQNVVFKAFVAFAEGGFIQSITKAVDQMNRALESPEGLARVKSLGGAFGSLVEVLAKIPQNLDTIAIALALVFGRKMGPIIAALVLDMKSLVVAAADSAKGLYATAAASGAAAAGARGLAGALAFLTSSSGIGAIVTAVAVGLTWWATRTNDASVQLEKHSKIVDQVKAAYAAAGDNVSEFAKRTEGMVLFDAEENARKMAVAYRDALEKVGGNLTTARNVMAAGQNFKGYSDTAKQARAEIAAVIAIFDQFASKQISLADMRNALDSIARSEGGVSERAKEMAAELLRATQDPDFRKLEQGTREAAAVVEQLKDKSKFLTDAQKELGIATDGVGEAMKKASAKALQDFGEAIDKLREKIPALAAEMKKFKDLEEVSRLGDQALRNAASGDELRSARNFQSSARASVAIQNMTEEQANQILLQYKAPNLAAESIILADKDLKVALAAFIESLSDGEKKMIRINSGWRSVEEQQRLIREGYKAASPDNSQHVNGGRAFDVSWALGLKNIPGLDNRMAQFNIGRPYKGDPKEEHHVEMLTQNLRQQTEEMVKQREKSKEYTDDLKDRLAYKRDELDNEGRLSREMAIRKALADEEKKAESAGVTLTEKQIAQVKQLAAAEWDAANAKRASKTATEEANDALAKAVQLSQLQGTLRQQVAQAYKTGNTDRGDLLKKQLEDVNGELKTAIDNATKMWLAIGGPEAEAKIANLQKLQVKLGASARTTFLDWQKVGNLIADGVVNAFDNFAQAVGRGVKAGEAARQAFLQFAADFLREIAKMILRQLALNAIQAIGKAFGFSGFGAGVQHAGGIAGFSNRRRLVDPAIFGAAIRYHGGGIAGLAPDEVPAILQRNEEVITRSDPRHILNGGLGAPAASAPTTNVKIVNTIDAGEFVSEGVATSHGERAILNMLRANKSVVKGLLA